MAACEVNMAIASALKNSAPLYDIHFALTDLEENGLCIYKNHGIIFEKSMLVFYDFYGIHRYYLRNECLDFTHGNNSGNGW